MQPLSLLSSINEMLHGRPYSIYSLVSINVLKFTHQSLELFKRERVTPSLNLSSCLLSLSACFYVSSCGVLSLFLRIPNCAFISETPHHVL